MLDYLIMTDKNKNYDDLRDDKMSSADTSLLFEDDHDYDDLTSDEENSEISSQPKKKNEKTKWSSLEVCLFCLRLTFFFISVIVKLF